MADDRRLERDDGAAVPEGLADLGGDGGRVGWGAVLVIGISSVVRRWSGGPRRARAVRSGRTVSGEATVRAARTWPKRAASAGSAPGSRAWTKPAVIESPAPGDVVGVASGAGGTSGVRHGASPAGRGGDREQAAAVPAADPDVLDTAVVEQSAAARDAAVGVADRGADEGGELGDVGGDRVERAGPREDGGRLGGPWRRDTGSRTTGHPRVGGDVEQHASGSAAQVGVDDEGVGVREEVGATSRSATASSSVARMSATATRRSPSSSRTAA